MTDTFCSFTRMSLLSLASFCQSREALSFLFARTLFSFSLAVSFSFFLFFFLFCCCCFSLMPFFLATPCSVCLHSIFYLISSNLLCLFFFNLFLLLFIFHCSPLLFSSSYKVCTPLFLNSFFGSFCTYNVFSIYISLYLTHSFSWIQFNKIYSCN